MEEGKRNEAAGVHRYSIVTAGRGLHGRELDHALEAYRRLGAETGLALCASHGLQSVEEFQAMREAGVTRYHANLETSRRNFPNICTTHTYEDKLENIRRAQAAGLEVCSGGILGMGETWEDRIDMALDLSELGVVSIPLNLLTPIPGTPLEEAEPLTEGDVFRLDSHGGGAAALCRRRKDAVPVRGQRGHHRGHAHHHRDRYCRGPDHVRPAGL